MGVANVHTLSHIKNGATVLSQLSNSSATPGIDLLVSSPSGSIFPAFVASQSQLPEVSFDTTQIATLLAMGAVGAKPDTIADLGLSSTVDTTLFYEETLPNGIIRTAGANSTTLTMANAVLICNQITAGHRTQAVASCVLKNPFDGTNAPIVPSGSGTVAETKTDAEHYIVGSVKINGAAITNGVQDVTINFGQVLFELGSDGQNYITFVGINKRQPVITITGHDLGWVQYGLNGTDLTEIIVYLRLISQTGPTATGISFTATVGASVGTVTVDASTGSGDDAATSTIRCTLTEALVINLSDTVPAPAPQ